MAERDRASFLALIYLVCLVAQAVSNPVNIPLGRVPPRLLGKAWRALNEHSPTHHLYAHGNLINAQELEEPPYKVYKFTYDLSPICGTESCPREACTIDLKQDEHGDIETLNDSIQCMYFYPADAQNDMSQEQQSYQEQEDSQVTQENLAEQVNNNRSVELDHEIQETGDENVRTFVAVRANNYCPGCPYELNPNLPGLLPFVEQALKLMDEQTANDYKHKLMSIVRVTRSVPVSSNVIEYQLLLQIGESECLKNALDQEQECPLRTTVPTKLCLVTFEQRPWQQTSLRVVKNNCTDPENTSSANSQTQRSLESESLVTVKYDEGRFATEKFAAYEGLKEMLDNYTHAPSVPSKEPEEVAMTESAIVKVVLNKSQDDEETLGFMNKTKEYREFLEDFDLPVKVEDATVEMAGSLKEVKEEKFQRKKVEDFKLEKANNKEDVNNRKKRSQRLFGAPEPIPVDHPDIQLYVNKTLQKISAESNEPNEPYIEIIEASVQVVSGQLYKIKAKLGTSDCPKGTISNCQLQAGSEMKECLIKILSQPWVDKGSPEITVECPSSENNRKKRSPPLVGAPATIPVDHPDVQLYVNKAQQKISAESNEPYIEIIEASVQVVAGQLYKIKAKLGISDCPKGTTSNCQLQAGSEMKECLIKVWSRPWLDNGSPEITVECPSSENKRKKRSQPGAPETIPIDHPDVQLYVNKAQEKFSAESNEPNEPYIEIIEASVQVVTGRLYKIKTKLGTSDCPKGTTSNCQLQAGSEMKECLIKVWSRPWLDHGSPEITTECSSSENKRKKRSLRGTNYNNNMMRIAEDMKIERLFNVFVETYNRTYSTADEKNLRLQIFRENLGIIDLLQRNEQGTARYGVNMFADVSREEFRQRYLGLRPDLQSENEIPLPQAEIPDVDLPPTFDWRKKNVVTSVKDQGSCGSCWAFSVTGNVEGQYAIKHGQLLSLSEQELVDCDDLDDGCSGGLPDNAYRAIEKLGGLELETDYPYEAENEKCHFKRNLARVQLASAVNITSNETQMAQWLVQNGPISIGINANAMQFYMGGVSHPFKFLCNPNNLDHGVLIVGYGTSSYPLFHRKLPYWIVKNSWGKSWGEQGYYRVYRGDGTCGLNMMASSAVVV